MKKRKLIIFPFNGNGLEALDCMDEEQYEFLGFVDDDQQKRSTKYEIFNRAILARHSDLFVLAVPGSPNTFRERKKHIDSLMLAENRFISLVHQKASIGANAKIGYNCLIMAGVVITSNACLNNHICVLPNTVIHHDVKIKDYTLIGSNVVIAGGTRIGANCYLGSGTNIINGVQIHDHCLVGLGSNVLRDVPGGSIVAGNPAKNLRSPQKDEIPHNLI